MVGPDCIARRGICQRPRPTGLPVVDLWTARQRLAETAETHADTQSFESRPGHGIRRRPADQDQIAAPILVVQSTRRTNGLCRNAQASGCALKGEERGQIVLAQPFGFVDRQIVVPVYRGDDSKLSICERFPERSAAARTPPSPQLSGGKPRPERDRCGKKIDTEVLELLQHSVILTYRESAGDPNEVPHSTGFRAERRRRLCGPRHCTRRSVTPNLPPAQRVCAREGAQARCRVRCWRIGSALRIGQWLQFQAVSLLEPRAVLSERAVGSRD